jgi:hypothetical protein
MQWRTVRKSAGALPPLPVHESVLKPELGWEGVAHPLLHSKIGKMPSGGERALRDPHLFQDVDNKWYLFYAGSGEMHIGVADVRWGKH